ncbi:hypothetical protein C8J31_10634 [Rhizobium sp. PP-CC-2G-626]|nr:hypothetical protein C8J31_10634 [Rhizobium sp. PP-CC-2G-626]
MKLARRLTLAAFAGVLALGTAMPSYAADLIAIITPSHDIRSSRRKLSGRKPRPRNSATKRWFSCTTTTPTSSRS